MGRWTDRQTDRQIDRKTDRRMKIQGAAWSQLKLHVENLKQVSTTHNICKMLKFLRRRKYLLGVNN